MKAFAVQWHITTRCNQRCQHCYIFNSPEGEKEIAGEARMSWSKIKSIVDDIKKTMDEIGAVCHLSITGGDPLLHPDFYNLLSYVNEVGGMKVSLMGNPWLITNDEAKKLKLAGVDSYQLSLDGMEKTHDNWRRKGSFAKTLEAVKILQENDIRASIMTTVSKANAAEIPEVIKLVSDELGVSVFAFARYVPTHDDVGDMFSPEEYRQFLDKIWSCYESRVDGKTFFNLKDHLWLLYLFEKGLFKPQDTQNIVVSGCGVGNNHISILADGTVYACRRFNSPLGTVPEDNLIDLFFGEKMEEYRDLDALDKCNDCFLKYYCRGCMAVAYGVSGDWRKPDPQCWR